MIDLRNANNKVSKVVYSVVILIAAFIAPYLTYKLSGIELTAFEPTQWFLLGCYIFIVVGALAMVFDARIVNITTVETDEMLVNKFKRYSKKLTPIFWLIVAIYFVWVAIDVWRLFNEA